MAESVRINENSMNFSVFPCFQCFSDGVEIVVFRGASLTIQTCGAQGFGEKTSENDHFYDHFFDDFREF